MKITSNPVTSNPVYFESNDFKSNNFKFSYFKFSNLKTSTFESMDFESKDFKSNNYESNNIKCFECYPDHFMDALNGLNWGFVNQTNPQKADLRFYWPEHYFSKLTLIL